MRCFRFFFSVVALCVVAHTCAFAASLRIITIPSSSMQTEYKATVVLPDSYNTSAKRYPAIYLLHGYSQNHTVWPKVAPLDEYADRYEVVFVCPDGAYNSWYIDSPLKASSKFETYIAVEVVAFIDSSFRVFDSPEGRAIAGSSMGGYGALRILFRHQNRFAAASSISGTMDLTQFPYEWDIASLLGPYDKNRDTWKSMSVLFVADSIRIRNRHFALDCGTDDRIAIESNRALHQKLIDRGIAHMYREAPGGHTPRYVREATEYHVLFLSRVLRKAQK